MLEDIKKEIKALRREEAGELLVWLAEYLDDEGEIDPQFEASIERGKDEVRRGETRVC